MAKKSGKILVVDDNVNILNSLKQLLKYEFELIETIDSPKYIPNILRTQDFDVILLDMNFTSGVHSGNEGIFWMKEILGIDPNAVVIMITAYGGVELAVKAMKEGATDFIVKPWDPQKLIATLISAIKYRQTKLKVKSLKGKEQVLNNVIDQNYSEIIGSSPKFKQVLDVVHKVSVTDANVLFLGENGTGKELMARELHRKSERNNESFISVDLAALNESLFESELFGHVKGSYTDAKDSRTGRFEAANGGTLFLDEIGNLSMSLQSKLLTAIEKKVVTPLGSNQQIPIDVRLICATNKNLDEMVKLNTFREDLLYRINTIQLTIPSLRDRGDDIPMLTDFYLRRFSQKYQKPYLKISGKGYDKLSEHAWPGNVRELSHVIERAVIMTETDILSDDDFVIQSVPKEQFLTGSKRLEDIEREALNSVLQEAKGNLSQAAKVLDISRTTLYSKIKKHGL